MFNVNEKLYSASDVARILNVSYMTVYRWIQSGEIGSYKVQKQYRIKASELNDFVSKGGRIKVENISSSLAKFIGSGMMDYAYMENQKFGIDLSLGVNPLGCSNLVAEYCKNSNIDFTNYSEVLSSNLRRKVAKYCGYKTNEILLGAGVSDLLHLCYLAFVNPGDEVVLPEITFPSFEFLAILSHGTPKFVNMGLDWDLDYERISQSINTATKLVVLCNPNNPTGKGIRVSNVDRVISKNTGTIFLIDEANIDFGGKTLINLNKKYPNVLVLRSFSKGFGLAGLRVGYILGHSDNIYALQRRQTPFSVNVFGQKLAEIALEDQEFLRKTKEYVLNERKYLESELMSLGYKYVDSDSNYLLVDITSKFASSKDFIKIINSHDANVVDGDDFRGLGGHYVRLSPRLHQTNVKFVEVLKKIEGLCR